MAMELNINKDSSSIYELVTDHVDFCEICHNERHSGKSVLCSCNHSFCQACFTDYFYMMKSDYDFYPFRCPAYGCEKDVYKALANVLSEDQYEEFKRLRKRKKLIRNPKVAWCPVVNCDGYGIKDKDNKLQCRSCEAEITTTSNPDAQELMKYASLIECPGCGCLAERTFGCLNAKCYCGIKFCMKCGRENDRHHDSLICLASDNSGNISWWVLIFTIFSHILVPLYPLCIVYWYRNYWDKNYISVVNEHPWFYGFVIAVFSPMILVFSLFYLPFVFGWYCVDAMFNGKEAKYRRFWVLLKLLLYFPAVFLTFVGFLLALELFIALAPLYGLGLLGYLIFGSKKSKE